MAQCRNNAPQRLARGSRAEKTSNRAREKPISKLSIPAGGSTPRLIPIFVCSHGRETATHTHPHTHPHTHI